MWSARNIGLILLGVFLCIFRMWFGIQVNWVEEDYIQIYLIGLEDAYVLEWSYWGPDVIWSRTRIPGAMQGLLAGTPLRVVSSIYAPIVFSNLISIAGILLFAWYAHRRFPSLPVWFLLPYLLLLPFPLYHGSVLLNTAYLIFSGALLLIVLFELFLYRDDLLIPVRWGYALWGFALLFTFQLHLTWVMFFPYLLVISYLEWKREGIKHLMQCGVFFVIGAAVSGAFLLPTVLRYHDVLFSGAEGNLVFKPERLLRVFDVIARMMSYGNYDVDPQFMYYQLSASRSGVSWALQYALKGFGIVQIIVFLLMGYRLWPNEHFRKTALLLGLTILMALGMFVISNKHLSSRTYILVTFLPIWFSLFTYAKLWEWIWIRKVLVSFMMLLFTTLALVGWHNQGQEFSFGYPSRKEKLERAIREKDPYVLGKRRRTKMDELR